jgi:hypothetical protein
MHAARGTVSLLDRRNVGAVTYGDALEARVGGGNYASLFKSCGGNTFSLNVD